MTLEAVLNQRSGGLCELCGATESLAVYEVPPNPDGTAEACVLICQECCDQIQDADKVNKHHWRCLNSTMWSEVPAVQVMAWRMLYQLSQTEAWAQDLLDTLFLEESVQEWAQAGVEETSEEERYLDCNGAELQAGDTVTLIKDLVVKGGGFTAKRGTPVRRILLAHGKHQQIEGRVDGQLIVILTKFVKKA